MVLKKKTATSKKSAAETKKATAEKKVASPRKKTAIKVEETATKVTKSATRVKKTTAKSVTPKKVKTVKKVQNTKTTGAAKTVKTVQNDNLTKAEKLRQYFQDKKMDMFDIEEMNDDNETAVFRTRMEIDKTMLPMAILLDSSAYVLIQVELMPTFIKNDEQFELFAKPLIALNNAMRPFKFAVSGKGDLMLNMILTFPNAQFDPAFCHAIVLEIMKYLDKDYKNLVNACLKIMGR